MPQLGETSGCPLMEVGMCFILEGYNNVAMEVGRVNWITGLSSLSLLHNYHGPVMGRVSLSAL